MIIKARINDPDLDVDETCILVMKNAGPKSYPGMAEVGNMGLLIKDFSQRYYRHGSYFRRTYEWNCVWQQSFYMLPLKLLAGGPFGRSSKW